MAIGTTQAVVIDGVNMNEKYKGAVRSYPNDGHVPGFEFSQYVAVNPDSSTQWADEMNQAKAKIQKAREMLLPFKNAQIPAQAADMALPENQGLADALRGARKIVAAGPDERPRFHPNGEMFAEHKPLIQDWPVRKVGEKLAMVPEPYAQVHLDNIVFRIPKSNMTQVAALAVDDAITATRQFNKFLTYKDSPTGKPEVGKALKLLDTSETILDKAVVNKATGNSILNRIENRLWQMPPGQAKLVVGGSIAGASIALGAAAFFIRKNDD